MAIKTLEELDAKMAEQQERLDKKLKKGKRPTTPEIDTENIYWTTKMEKAFREGITKSLKCGCGYQNFGDQLVLMNTIHVMQESIPIPTIVCKQCGCLFIPKWARRVVNQAIAQERRIVKQGAGKSEDNY